MADRGELTLEQTVDHLKVNKMTVLRLIGSGTITVSQICKGAPWAIPEAQLSGFDLCAGPSRRPVTESSDQQAFDFQ